MSQAKFGDTVKVHFTGRLENGEVFDTSKEGQPLEFTIGKGDVVPGFEKGVIGIEVGETKTITVPPEEAFGPRHEELMVSVKRSDFPEHITPLIGKRLTIRLKGSDPIKVIVVDMNEDTVTLDGNHPLAGHTLTFNILLVAVK